MVGIPVAIVLGFVYHMKARGLWIGILVGSVLQSILLLVVAAQADWQKQVNHLLFPICVKVLLFSAVNQLKHLSLYAG